MKTLYYDIPGIVAPIPCKMYYEEGFSKIIIGAHGFAGSKETPGLYALAEAVMPDCALVCFDFPVHGVSLAKDEELTVENCLDSFVRVYNDLSERYPSYPLSVFGISFGGYTTVLAMLRKLIQPQRIVLQAPALEMAAIFRERLPGNVFEDFVKSKVLDFGFTRKMKVPFAFYEELLTIPIMEADIYVPTLIISGTEDVLVHNPMLHAFADERPSVTIVDIPGGSHSLDEDDHWQRVTCLSSNCFRYNDITV